MVELIRTKPALDLWQILRSRARSINSNCNYIGIGIGITRYTRRYNVILTTIHLSGDNTIIEP